MNAAMLSATYRKFTENITTTYLDSFEYSTLTVIDYNEGEVEERRIYKDNFKTNEGTSAEGFFRDLSNELDTFLPPKTTSLQNSPCSNL